MTLAEFIQEYGQLKLAKKLSVAKQAVYQWQHGITVPRPLSAIRIVELSKGRVSFLEIYKVKS